MEYFLDGIVGYRKGRGTQVNRERDIQGATALPVHMHMSRHGVREAAETAISATATAGWGDLEHVACGTRKISKTHSFPPDKKKPQRRDS
jgi:hypothetical protein